MFAPGFLATQPRSGRDVVVDGHRRKGVRALKHHTNVSPNLHRIGPLRVHVVLADPYVSSYSSARNHLVKSVDRSKEGGLSASGRTNNGCHLGWLHSAGDVSKGKLRTIPCGHLFSFHCVSHRRLLCSANAFRESVCEEPRQEIENRNEGKQDERPSKSGLLITW